LRWTATARTTRADIPRLLAKLDEGYDVVSGWRVAREDAALTRRLPSILANRLISALLHVFDQMLPRIAHYWQGQEVAALMAEAGLQDLRIAAVNGMSWAALGRRAADAGA
jgi:hypothetical protein